MGKRRTHSMTLAHSYDAEWQLVRLYWTKYVLGGWNTPQGAQRTLMLWTDYVRRGMHGVQERVFSLPEQNSFWREGEFGRGDYWGPWGGLHHASEDDGVEGVFDLRTLSEEEKGQLYWRTMRVVQAFGGNRLSQKQKQPEFWDEVVKLERWVNKIHTSVAKFQTHGPDWETFWRYQERMWRLLLSGAYTELTDADKPTVRIEGEDVYVPYYIWLIPEQYKEAAFAKVRSDLKTRVNTARHRNKGDLEGKRLELFTSVWMMDRIKDEPEVGESPDIPPPPPNYGERYGDL